MENRNYKDTNKEEERKPYIKPQIEQVKLILDDSILGAGCKETVDPCITQNQDQTLGS